MKKLSLQKLILVTFHLMFLTVPFFFTWVNEELFEFPKMLLTYGFVVIIAGLWVGRMISEKKLIIRQTAFDWPLLLFFIAQTLSTIFSIHPHTSIFGYYTRFHGGLISTITYLVLFYALVSNITKAQFKKLLTTIFIAALGVTLYAIPEHFGYSPSCLLITGKLNVSCWVQDVQSRVFATFGQPNWLAAYAITLMPLGIVLAVSNKKRLGQIFFSVTSLALFTTLLFTQSRSGMIGFLGSLLLLIPGLILIKSRRQTSTFKIKKYLWLLGGILVITLINGTTFSPRVSKLLTPKTTSVIEIDPTPTVVANRLETGGTDSGEIRKIVWQGAINIWKRYPIFGSGVETFAYSYYQDRPIAHNNVSEWDFLYNKAHNELLNFLATTGVVGLVTYLLLFAWLAAVSLKIILNTDQKFSYTDQTITIALLSGLLALSISNFFGFSTVMVSILLFTFLSTVAIINAQAEEEKFFYKKRVSSLSTIQIISLIVTFIGTIFLLNKVIRIWVADKNYARGKSYIEAGHTLEGLHDLQTAVKIRPNEALFHNQLADTYSNVAILLDQQNESTASAEFQQAVLDESELTLKLNPRHLNFYKSKARILITLSQLEPQLLLLSKTTLEDAIKLAPTDAKLMYNLGLVEISLDQVEAGINTLEKAVELKPNYEAARLILGKQYQTAKNIELAKIQYQYIYDHITQDNQFVNETLEELK